MLIFYHWFERWQNENVSQRPKKCGDHWSDGEVRDHGEDRETLKWTP